MAKMAEQDISYADTAPVIAEGTAVVDGTPAEVWAVLADHRTWPEWFPSVKKVEPTSTKESGVGMTRRVTVAGGPTVDERFIAWDEEKLWSFTGVSGKPAAFKKLVERAIIEPVDDTHTRITYRMAFEPAAVFKPLSGILKKQISKQITQGMVNLGKQVTARR